jgi:hypothetical protein
MHELMDQAVRLKQAQVDSGRVRWNSWPSYLQNTLFHASALCETRLYPQADASGYSTEALRRARDACDSLCTQGRAKLEADCVTDGCFRLEEAIAQFDFVVPLTPQWRDKGIRDEDLSIVSFSNSWRRMRRAADADEIDLCVRSLADAYVELSGAVAKQQRWALSEQAARHVIDNLDPGNLRAAWLAATAMTSAPTATTLQTDRALELLAKSVSASSPGVEGLTECVGLTQRLLGQKQKEASTSKKMFKGIFDEKRWAEDGRRDTNSSPAPPTSTIPKAIHIDNNTSGDNTAAADALTFPADAAKAPIFRDMHQGWQVVQRMRDEASARAGRSEEGNQRADELNAKADGTEAELVAVCAKKLFQEALEPAMANSPCLLRLNVATPDLLELKSNVTLARGRSVVRLLGFDPTRWNDACRRPTTGTRAVVNKETRLYEDMRKLCEQKHCNERVERMRPLDTVAVLRGAELLDNDAVLRYAAGDAGAEVTKLRGKVLKLFRQGWQSM